MSELSKSERIFLKGGFGPSQEYLDAVTKEQDAWTWVNGLEHVPEKEMEDTPGLEGFTHQAYAITLHLDTNPAGIKAKFIVAAPTRGAAWKLALDRWDLGQSFSPVSSMDCEEMIGHSGGSGDATRILFELIPTI